MNKVKNRQKMMDQKMNVRKQMKLKDDGLKVEKKKDI